MFFQNSSDLWPRLETAGKIFNIFFFQISSGLRPKSENAAEIFDIFPKFPLI